VSPAASVSTIEGHLENTGKPVTDPTNNVTIPRLQVLAGSTRLRDTGFKAGGTFTFPGGDVASNGVGLATRAGAPASGTIAISGIPAGSVVRNAFLYWMTIGGPDTSAVFNGTARAGTLVGAADNTGWVVNGRGANRVYRATLPVSAVPGNGTYTVSGVGGVGGADGQGASLVVVYSRAASTQTGRVVIRHGALSASLANETMTHSFTGLQVPRAPTQLRLHIGMGDGQPQFTENPVRFAATAVTPANFYPGDDGPLWDDDRITVPTSLLPAGTASRANSIQTANDGLAWAYAALAYQHP